jgi:hypothetical protein
VLVLVIRRPDFRTFWSEYHDIALPVRPSVDDIFVAANIVPGVIYTHDIVFVHPIMLEEYSLPGRRIRGGVVARGTQRKVIYTI